MTDLEKLWSKVSYDHDFYKFCFSFGVLLIVSASIIPFLGLKYTHDEFRSYWFAYSSEALSKAGWSKDLIDSYQKNYLTFLESIIRTLPFLNFTLSVAFLAGVVLTVYGFVKWRERQKVRDEIENAFLKKLKLNNEGFDV